MKVRYNGEIQTHYVSQNPSKLVNGKIYNVVRMTPFNQQANLIIEGLDEDFNSAWFDEVNSDDNIYMAYSDKVPVVGTGMTCTKLDLSGRTDNFVNCITSPVQEVSKEYDEDYTVYRVKTLNSTYMITIVEAI